MRLYITILFFLSLLFVSCSRELVEPLDFSETGDGIKSTTTKALVVETKVETAAEAAFHSQADPFAKYLRQIKYIGDRKVFTLSAERAKEIGIDDSVIAIMSDPLDAR